MADLVAQIGAIVATTFILFFWFLAATVIGSKLGKIIREQNDQ